MKAQTVDEQQDDDLVRTVRQKSQLELVFPPRATGEARNEVGEASEIRTVSAGPESSMMVSVTMEAVVVGNNLRRALAQVRRNQGAPGIDGMTIEDLAAYLKDHWTQIRAQLLDGSYRPQPVRRVEIPKASGGTRALGIPTPPAMHNICRTAVYAIRTFGGVGGGSCKASSYPDRRVPIQPSFRPVSRASCRE